MNGSVQSCAGSGFLPATSPGVKSAGPSCSAGSLPGLVRADDHIAPAAREILSVRMAISGWPVWAGVIVTVLLVLSALIFPPVSAADPAYMNGTPVFISTAGTIAEDGPSLPGALPSIAHDDTPGFFNRTSIFPFREDNITIAANVSAGVYYGARAGTRYAIAPAGESYGTMASAYYRAFVSDPAQDAAYSGLIRQFRIIRDEHRYSDDEYAELLTVFVQNLPFDNASAARPDAPPRFPAETLVEGTGDCDDKSLLLAGLLSREGYNVSLLLFIPEHHVAVGIAGDCLRFNDTGYLYTETTGISFIGAVPKRLNQPGALPADTGMAGTVMEASEPLVIRIGNGTKTFSSSDEVGFILGRKKIADDRVASLKLAIENSSRDDPRQIRELISTYDAYAAIHNTLVTHRYDRAGMFRYLAERMPPSCSDSYRMCEIPAAIPGSAGNGTSILTDDADTNPRSLLLLPCPRGILSQPSCIWQNARQALVTPQC